jgi:hypothetical protein
MGRGATHAHLSLLQFHTGSFGANCQGEMASFDAE